MKQVLWALVAGGVWIAVSPWVLGFASANLGRWSNVLIGGLIAIGALSLAVKGERD
ncbi:MAG: SPW repeat protein [Candidatus Brennerbacteria bacterium]